MWIKHSRIRTQKTDFHYIQLMKTLYKDGKSRQKLVLNLGRAEDVDIELARKLAKSISSESNYDYVDEDALSLLPTKYYGEIHILIKLFEITSMQRFCLDSALSLGMGEDSVQSIFLLLCFYFLNLENYSELSSWCDEYYVRHHSALEKQNILSAMRMLISYKRFHPGIKTLYRNSLKNSTTTYQLYCPTRYRFRNGERSGYSLFTLDADNLPLDYGFHYDITSAFQNGPGNNRVFVSDDSRLYRRMLQQQQEFIVKVPRAQLSLFFNQGHLVEEFASAAGQYDAFRNFGYICSTFEDKTVCVIADGPGRRDAVSMQNPEVREILVSNCSLDIGEMLSKYFLYQQIAEICAEVSIPNDMAYLYECFKPEELIDALIHLQSIQIFLMSFLESKLQGKQSFEEALRSVRNIRVARLQLDKSIKLIRNTYSPAQEALLNIIAFH